MIVAAKHTYLKLKYRVIDLFLTREAREKYHRGLWRWNNYFRALGPDQQREFVVRTHLFIRSTTFRSEVGFPITEKMKIILAGIFVQITFGLKEDVLDYFHRICLFSKPYTYKNSGLMFKGDVNPITGTINLSWPAIEKGLERERKGKNLAIHEFGHCLILENAKRNYFQQILNAKHLRSWEKHAKRLLPSIRKGQSPLFRAYGGTNMMELFSVSLETFFEKPHAFYAQAPEFYKSMSKLLRQDPREFLSPVIS